MFMGYYVKLALIVALMSMQRATVEGNETKSPRELRMEFIRAMQEVEEEKREEADRMALYERLLNVARMISPGNIRRHLSYGKYYNKYNNGYGYNGVVKNNNQHVNNTDDLYSYEFSSYSKINVNLTSFALKYVGCQNIHSWSDNRAQNNQNPLAMKRFVVFRVCPADQCSAYNKLGCSSNYGEYAIPMETYLTVMAQYHLKQFNRYCQTCHDCMKFDNYTFWHSDDQFDDGNSKSKKKKKNKKGDDAYQSSSGDDYYTYRGDDASGYNGGGSYSQQYKNNGGNNQQQANQDDLNEKVDDDGAGRIRRRGLSYSAYTYNRNYDNKYHVANSNYDSSTSSSSSSSYGNNGGKNYVYNPYSYNNGYNNYGSNPYSNNGYNNYGYNNGYDYYGNPYGYNYGGSSNYQKPQKSYPSYIDLYGQCKFQSVCQNYRKACRNYRANTTFYEDYFSCTKFKVGNKVGYLGPHCRSDGHTIGIGIYEDEYCAQYKGDVNDLSAYTRQNFDDADLQNYYDKSCISCQATDGFALIPDSNFYTTSKTYPLCAALYDQSAKCDANLNAAVSDSQDQQQTNEEVTCSFIASLSESNFDEFGEVITPRDYNVSNWASPREYAMLAKKASPAQIFFLFLTLCTSFALLGYAMYLHKKLYFRVPWKPPKRVNSPVAESLSYDQRSVDARSEAGRLSRINSGIIAMRSRSVENGSYYGSQTNDESSWAPSHATGGAYA